MAREFRSDFAPKPTNSLKDNRNCGFNFEDEQNWSSGSEVRAKKVVGVLEEVYGS